ncbi:hypothetical protein ABIA39_008538 [Nocardia sp. GAS34]|uniref:hypothetical protein n=1 Tax=unclassified Nocardia TaxID=2637762 RepID=UPI003D1EE21E
MTSKINGSGSVFENDAGAGSVELEDGAIEACRAACSEAIGRLIGVRDYVNSNMLTMPPFTKLLGSAANLAGKYSVGAGDLHDIVKNHIDIQNQMADAFRAAGKAYINAEVESSDQFKRLQALDKLPPMTTSAAPFVTDPSTIQPDLQLASSYGLGNLNKGKIKNSNGNPNGVYVSDLPADLKGYSGDKLPGLPVEGENPDHWQYDFFRQLGDEIDYQTAATRAGQWDWVHGELNDLFTNFNNAIGAVVNSRWQGNGASNALKATTQYVDAADSLRTNIGLFTESLKYTAGWLQLTKASMPIGPDLSGRDPSVPSGPVMSAPGGGGLPAKSVYPDQTPIYRENFKNTYLVGLPVSDNAIPGLPVPVSPINPIPTGGGHPTSGGGQPTSGGGQPTTAATTPYMGGGGVSPLRTPALTAAGLPNYSSASDSAATDAARQQKAQLTAAYQREAAANQKQQQLNQQNAQANDAAVGQAQDSSPAQQAMSGAGQGVDQALTGLQQLAQTAGGLQQAAARDSVANPIPGLPGLDLPNPANLAKAPGAGGSGIGGALGSELSRDTSQATSKLFPRVPLGTAVSAETMGTAVGRAGLASTMGAPGTPGSPAGAPHGAGGQQSKEYKRPANLDSTKHLDEGIGEAPRVARQVIEQ